MAYTLATLALGTLVSWSVAPFAAAQDVNEVTDPKVFADQWAKAINSGDVESWMALHALDVIFANHGWFTGNTREEMRRWGDAVVASGGAYTIEDARIEGDSQIWLIDYKDRSFAIQEMGTVTVVGGAISKLILGDRPE
jgi:SnoaL-like domain